VPIKSKLAQDGNAIDIAELNGGRERERVINIYLQTTLHVHKTSENNSI